MRNFTRILPVAILFLIAPAFTAYSDSPAKQKLKIGVSTALSGDGATWGLDIRDALLFANEKLGQERFELIFEDDRCSGKDAVTVAHKLIERDKVNFVMGLACSSAALASAPLYERSQIPVIIVAASSPAIADAGSYIFRTTPSDKLAAQVLYKHIQAKHSSVAIISAESDYCQDLKNSFIDANKDKSLKISNENYLPDLSDFKPLIMRLRAQKSEALFINTQYESTFALILKQLKELNWQLPLYGAYWPSSPVLLDLARNDLEEIEFVDTPSLINILLPEGQNLFGEYTKKFGKIRSIESVFATTYEAFNALSQAVESGENVRKFLEHTKFKGIFGPFHFDNSGDIVGMNFVMKHIENGKVKVFPAYQ